jgi:hypothetical protein
MNPSKYERKKPEWKDQSWRLGKMLHVGLTGSHVHEGLLHIKSAAQQNKRSDESTETLCADFKLASSKHCWK